MLDRPAAQVLTRLGLLAGAAVALAAVVQHVRLPPLCLLRAATGIPCPFCGGTTAAAHVGQGQLLAALSASPLAVLGAPTWALWPAVRDRAGPWLGRHGAVAVASALAASQVWQLVRVLG